MRWNFGPGHEDEVPQQTIEKGRYNRLKYKGIL